MMWKFTDEVNYAHRVWRNKVKTKKRDEGILLRRIYPRFVVEFDIPKSANYTIEETLEMIKQWLEFNESHGRKNETKKV